MPFLSRTGRAVAAGHRICLVAPFAPAFANGGPNSGDPGVARISDVSGGVDVHRTDVSGAYAAALNAPVSVGDYIETQSGARAEVEFDHATALRIAPSTQLRFTHLTPDDHDVQLAQGTVELRLFRGTDGNPVVETPSVVVVARPTRGAIASRSTTPAQRSSRSGPVARRSIRRAAAIDRTSSRVKGSRSAAAVRQRNTGRSARSRTIRSTAMRTRATAAGRA